ncbi:MAG: UbiA prenyltransferase family protein [Chloroflexi bacterium]|nr:UbiA prenyltransferase family protein [Chloroflexota bacterium]
MSGAVALVAGASPELAARIGLAMTLLQLGIGTVNDIVDAPHDAGRKPGKPIPAGHVRSDAALVLAAACFGGGVVLATAISSTTGILAVMVIGIGLAYDLRLKGTAWSWLPFAVGIPILPVFGWVGTSGSLHPVFTVLLPTAFAAGAALAIGNALVDVDRDRDAGISSIAVALGSDTAAWLAVALLGSVWALAWSTALRGGAGPFGVAIIAVGGLVPLAAAAAARTADSARRERLWQVETVGLALLATVWLAVLLGTGEPVA